MKTTRARTLTAGTTLLAPISWGTTYVVITELLPAGRPLLVAAMRVVPSGLVLVAAGAVVARRRARTAALALASSRPADGAHLVGVPRLSGVERPQALGGSQPFAGWRPQGDEWGRTAILALFNFGLFFPLLVAAVYRLPGGVAAAVGGLQPLLVGGVAWLVAGRRPHGREIAVGLAAVLGVALVVLRPGAHLDAMGVLAAAGANVSFAVGMVLTKRFPAPANRLAATGWQLLLGGVLLVPLTAVVEGAPPALTGRSLAGFAYLSLAATALAFVLWFNGVRRLPTAAPPLLGLAAPVTGATLGWAILDQSLSPLQLTGFALTLAAIAYGTTIGAAAPPSTEPSSLTPLRASTSSLAHHQGHSTRTTATVQRATALSAPSAGLTEARC